MQPNREFQEKRDYIRMKVDTPVSVQVISDGETLDGVCKDLSGGGLSIELSRTLPVGTVAEVAIASKHGHTPMFTARATVTRIEAVPSGSSCLLGMKIEEVLS